MEISEIVSGLVGLLMAVCWSIIVVGGSFLLAYKIGAGLLGLFI